MGMRKLVEKPLVRPVQAWMVVDKDGKFDPEVDLKGSISSEEYERAYQDRTYPSRAPHKIVRVEITQI